MQYPQFVQDVIAKLRSTDLEADKALVRAKLAEVEAQLARLADEYQGQNDALVAQLAEAEANVASLRSQQQSVNDSFSNNCGVLEAERGELSSALEALDAPVENVEG